VSEALACPVCRAPAPLPFVEVDGRAYRRCQHCEVRFLDPAHRLSVAAERAHYAWHRNEVDDPRYRRFLSRLAEPLLRRLPPASRGLDFGCGPGPALAAMLREAGHEVALYDPCFRPDPAPLQRTFHFITLSEVAEHLHDPAATFDRLAAMLGPGGWLAVMTRFQTDDARFAAWHYRRDPTHVVFYRERSFAVLAERLGLHLEVPAPDIALMRKPVP
jgi:SAM-dependent methyltransferase